MGSLFASLQGLIITVRRNVWSSILTITMLFFLIVMWSARDNITTFFERNPSTETEKDRFNMSIVADSQINETLDNIRVKLNGDRLLIRQFHNSKTDLTGLPFASVSTTYFSLAPGVTLDDSALQPFPLSTINEQLAMMFQPGEAPKCAKVVQDAVTDPVYQDYMLKNGVAVSFSCPLINLRGQPVGIIGVVYLTQEKHRSSDQDIEYVLNDTSIRVVSYLSAVITDEKKSWKESIFDWK